jgi:hypothetical protein
MNNKSTIIRVSGKLGDKIHSTPEDKIPLHDNPYLDWSAHLFRAPRTEYILVTNTASLYSILIFGRGITDENQFFKRAIRQLEDMLEEDGFRLIFKRIIAPALGPYTVSKALNRSVTGSMNDLVKNAQSYLADGEVSPYRAAQKLNDMPVGSLDYLNPKEAFQKLETTKDQPG